MKWLFGICIVLFSACQQTEKPEYAKLTGHWHIFHHEEAYKGSYEIIDFENSIFYEGGYEHETSKGYADFPNQTLYFSPVTGRLSFLYKYGFSGDSLLLKGIEANDSKVLAYDFYAVKVSKKICTSYEHLSRYSGLNVDLPTIVDFKGFDTLTPLGWQNTIHVGYLKKGELTNIVIKDMNDRDLASNDLSLFMEKHKICVPVLNQSEIELTFYTDKETKIKHLKPILQKLAEIPDRPKVVGVFQYNPQPDDFELFGKEVVFEGVDWETIEDELLFSEYVLIQ
ncbi:MAG: hypothetical protein ACI85O_000891 [Saprospiraceae bacterium]|jgi:hypothetical protein